MRRQLLWMLMLLCGVTMAHAQGGGKIAFEVTEHDFGRIPEKGGAVSYTFRFTNTGDAPVVLQGVSTSCGCTASEWSNEPVLPGKQGSVTARFDPYGRPNGFMKSITVRSNADPQSVVLYIKGFVVPREVSPEEQYQQRYGALGVRASCVSMQQVLADQAKREVVSLYNFGDKPLKVSFSKLPNYLTISPKELTLQPKAKGEVEFTIDGTRVDDWGLVSASFAVTAGAEKGTMSVLFSRDENFAKMSDAEYSGSARVSFATMDVDMGTIPSAKGKTMRVGFTNVGQKPLIVRKVSTSCDCLKASVSSKSVAPGQSAELVLEYKSAQEGKGSKNWSVMVITNDPSSSASSVAVRALVD